MATTIGFLSSKGGCGKSTNLCGVVSVLSMFSPDEKILVVDAGGQPNTLLHLEGAADQIPNVDTAVSSDYTTLSTIRSMPTEHSWKFIDLPGYGHAEEARAILTGDGHQPVADLLVVPMGPSQYDLEAVVPYVQSVIQPSGIPYGVVLSLVPPRALAEAIDLQRQLGTAGVDTFQSMIRQYRGMQHAARDRRLVTTYGGKHDPIRHVEDDCRALTREIVKRVGADIHIPSRADQAAEERRG